MYVNRTKGTYCKYLDLLVAYTDGATDPFSVTGVQLGLFNDSGQTITLTAVRILVQCTVDQT